MKILILSQYYPPETGAPQNRLQSLAKNMILLGHQVEVLTSMPNYPKSEVFPEYRGFKYVKEVIEGVIVHRSWIYVKKSNSMILRLLNYFSFVISSMWYAKNIGATDYVLVESPPLFLSWSAFWIAKRKKARVVFNVSDLWPESAEKLGIVKNKLLLKMAFKLEAWSYRKAFKVSGQTQGIVNNIKQRFPEVYPHWLRNGVDIDIYQGVEAAEDWKIMHGLSQIKVFLYAGIIGHAQGLEVIIHAARKLSQNENIKFVIVGDGPEKERLIALNKQMSAGVIFFPNIPKMTVLSWVASVYGFIVPLRKLDLFKGAIPSKLFDPLALGIPILLGVDGEAKKLFIEEGQCGLYFEPENTEQLVECVLNLSNDEMARNSLGLQGKNYVCERFDRKDIVKDFIKFIEQ